MDLIIGQTRHQGVIPPKLCAHCHVINDPRHRYEIHSKDFDNTDCTIQVWECADCERVYVVAYHKRNGKVIFRYLNGIPKGPIWPTPIKELKEGKSLSSDSPKSSKFIKTYLQSLDAESRGLDEIAGMGYRKAIEYLVKDWAIQNNPELSEKIQEKWLGQIISDHFTGDLKEMLERATWLGNDQAHYNKLFEEFDLVVLKELIGVVLAELDRDYKINHYKQTIQKRK